MKQIILVGLLGAGLVLAGAPARAQSLARDTPAPLRPGVNKSTVDSIVGGQYWTFEAGPGQLVVPIRYLPGTVGGSAVNTQLTFTLMAGAKVLHSETLRSTDAKPVSAKLLVPLARKTRILLAVLPVNNSLLRLGGDYEVEARGAVRFDAARAPSVVHTYKVISGVTQDFGTAKFFRDGHIETYAGPGGKWKLSDAKTQTYVIELEGQQAQTLKYVPGRGLCAPPDPNPYLQETP